MDFVKNEKGQMAIFIALFFQVIFVFFAMAINVGLVIHDKINLQNAVDLAAYYGAAKQAEVLNQMAHVNYQMRQNYKLFVWRYRVLGTSGNQAHPLNVDFLRNNGPRLLSDDADSTENVAPSICVIHSLFQESKDLDDANQNLCKNNSVRVPAVPSIPGVSGIVPGSSNLNPALEFLQAEINNLCLEGSYINWTFAARILAIYRMNGAALKRTIINLANALSSPEPNDIRGESIREGAYNTWKKNLTEANSNGEEDFQYYNSLSDASCTNNWLTEIKIQPVIYFSDWNVEGNSCNQAQPVPNRTGATYSRPHPAAYGGEDNLPSAFSKSGPWRNFYNSSRDLQFFWSGESNDEYHSSVGFEKNPWCMIYSGVKATTQVRKPFSPTGETITLEARGFAKPFGGRIGPWYGKQWPQGASNSVGSNPDQLVDPKLPSRNVPGGGASSDPNQDIANYSRYPGDVLGFASYGALGALSNELENQIHRATNHTLAASAAPLALANYESISTMTDIFRLGDILPREGRTRRSANHLPRHRPFEIAAVAPDVFDALYYSVEPRYKALYFNNVISQNGALIPENQKVFDFGSSKTSYTLLSRTYDENFNVMNQIEDARNLYMPNYQPIIKDWKNLLTSWHQKDIDDFEMDAGKFGNCVHPVPEDKGDFPTTGNCLEGGRTGYSVKNVSYDFLISSDHALGGGATGESGPIRNPPNL